MLENTNLKYLKLYNWGRTIIISGILKYGDKFPSENILQKKFAYSRQTVRAALNLLENEGLITRTRGSGTYVSYKIVKTDENTKTIGLMLSYFADYLFPQIYQGIESVMLEHNIKIDVAVTKNNLNNEAMYLERFHNTNVSGIIIEGTKTSFPNPNINLYEKLRKKNIPIIFIHNHYENLGFDSIEMADEKCSYALTKKLLDSGHKKISGIFKYDDIQGIKRYKGFIQCMTDNHIPIDNECISWYSTEDFDFKFSKTSLNSFLKRSKDCTALITYNDEVAYKYIEFLTSKNIYVPKDISIVSFDDARLISSEQKIFSAIHPKHELGRLAAKTLLKMLNDDNWKTNNYSYNFPVKFNDGNSLLEIRKKHKIGV
jgi:hypothetical protein